MTLFFGDEEKAWWLDSDEGDCKGKMVRRVMTLWLDPSGNHRIGDQSYLDVVLVVLGKDQTLL